MKKNNFLDGRYILAIGLTVLVLYIINVVFMSLTIRSSYSERIIQALGAMSATYGDIDKEVVDNVINNNSETYQEGKRVLKKFGYSLSGDTLIKNSMNEEIIHIAAAVFFILLFLMAGLYVLHRNHMRFLARLEGYLDNFSQLPETMEEANSYVRNLMDKLCRLSQNSSHVVHLIQQEKEKIHEFMDDLSHQMKTPLTVAHLCIERYILEHARSGTDRLEEGLNQLEKMTLLINSYLKIGMLKSSNTKLQAEDHNIHEFLEECGEDVQPLLDNKDMELVISGDRKDIFLFDSFWLKEAIINLLKNSAEHCPEGSVITVKFMKGRHELTIRITDEGNGIEENNLPVLFERFLSSVRQKDGSNGLGLAIAKQAVIRHFGQIGVKNNEDNGVTFEIRLPILNGKDVYNYYSNVR